MNINFNLNTKLKINNADYSVLSVAEYITKTNDSPYYKINLSNEKILVISLIDNFAYIGEIRKIDCQYTPVPILEYGNENFTLIGNDYQILKKIILGNIGNVEGDIDFIDFINKDETRIISLARAKGGERKDVYACIVDVGEIEVL